MRTVLTVLAVSSVLVGCSESSLTNTDDLAANSYSEPELRLVTPTAGSWLEDGATRVEGVAANLTDVTLNGQATTETADGFESIVELPRGITVLEAAGTDQRGDTMFIREAVLAGTFDDPGRMVNDAVGLRVNQSGLDFAMGKVGDLVNGLGIQDSVAGYPVYDDSYGIAGWDAVSITATIGDLYFTEIDLSADPNPGALDVTIEVPNLDVWIPVSGDIVGYEFSTDAWMWADRAEINATLTVDVDHEGELEVEFTDPRVDLVGFGYDTSLIPGEVESYVLVDTVRGFIEDKLVEEIGAQVPPLLEEQLAGLDLSFETSILDRNLEIEAGFADAYVDNNGLGLVADMDVHMPGNGAVEYAGYLAAPKGLSPRVDKGADVAMGLSDDLLNRILFEVWRAGVLDLTLSTEDGSLDAAMLSAFGGDHGGSITVSAALPPVVVESDGLLQLQAGELLVRIDTPDGHNGDYLDLALAIDAGLDLQVVDGLLTLDLDDPNVQVVVRDSDWGAARNETITRLLEEQLPVATLLGAVTDLEIELPTIGDVLIANGELDRDDTGFHTGLRLSLQ